MEHSSLHSPHHSAIRIAKLIQEGRAAADPHLAECEYCAEVARLLAESAPAVSTRETTAPVCHTADDDLAALLLEPAPAGAEQLLAHAAQCPRCAARLRELTGVLSDEPVEPPVLLRSSTAAWRREMARKMSGTEGRTGQSWWKPAAIAACLMIAALAGYRMLAGPGPEELLAQAYTQRRPFDYRLPDKGHARVSQRMSAGGTFDKPAALIQAQAKLAQMADAPVARGRAELLNGDLEAAIATLERARETAKLEAVALDLACAYAARGDGARPEDYAKALDLLERLLRVQPENRAALFNRALVLERLQRFDDAVESWDRYLQADSAGPWAAEARERRETAAQKKVS